MLPNQFVGAEMGSAERLQLICRAQVEAIISGWLNKRINRSTTALLSFFKLAVEVEKPHEQIVSTNFDRIRKLLHELKSSYSKVIQQNNGIDVYCLRNLLYPIGLDFGDDLNLVNSLRQLVVGRGDYAHRRRITKLMSPKDARGYVTDVLTLWRKLAESALESQRELTQ
jgi:hypothetical protein